MECWNYGIMDRNYSAWFFLSPRHQVTNFNKEGRYFFYIDRFITIKNMLYLSWIIDLCSFTSCFFVPLGLCGWIFTMDQWKKRNEGLSGWWSIEIEKTI